MELGFLPGWNQSAHFEDILTRHDPLRTTASEVRIRFPARCLLLVDTALRVLTLANQLANERRIVVLDFQEASLLGYLDRMGFFKALLPSVVVLPDRPAHSAHARYFGSNHSLVEIAPLDIGDRANSKTLPGALASRLADVVGARPSSPFQNEMFTVFAELIGNYFDHSESPLPGHVVAQTYSSRAPNVRVAISDSGLGITNTLRRGRPRDFAGKTDVDLLVSVFNEGISRFGANTGRGCGLHLCSRIFVKYGAEVMVRTPSVEFRLNPTRWLYEFRTLKGHLRGTQLSFEFRLDNPN